MPCVRSRNAYHHVSDFDKGQLVAYRNFGLPYHSIAACVGRYLMAVSRIGNRWVQDGNTERHAYLNGLQSLVDDKTPMLLALP
ncbi:hypothetical protein TNCV_2219171 [Trichonephila clavipes]|nr:hypothetical protein TNCV_2219171 [Trichonephila clavipes]